MALKLVRTETVPPEEAERFRLDEEDLRWLAEHAERIEDLYKGEYIAVVNKQLFVGASIEEAEALAREACPGRDPIVEQVPFKPRLLIL